MSTSSILFVLSALLSVVLPKSVDNSQNKYFPPPISQIGGSCAQASYIGYMYTYEINRLLDRDASLSPSYRFSYLYTWNFVNEGEDQGSFGYDGLQVAMANGVISEADFPSQGTATSFRWASGYDKYYRAMHYRAGSLRQMPVETEEDIQEVKRYLFDHGEPDKTGGIVTFSAKATDWKFDNNYSGPSETKYKSLLTALAPEGGHAMTIVGYDDLVEFSAPDGTLSQGAFIVMNSWGTWMHDNGRFYLPYWFFLNNTPEAYAKYSLSREVCSINAEYREPLVTFKVGIDCDARNNLSFMLGAAEGAGAISPSVNHREGIANYQGGSYNMQGRFADSNIEFGFDFTSDVKHLTAWSDATFFLTVSRNARGSKRASFAKLTALSVLDYRTSRTHPKIYTLDIPEEGIELNSGNNVFSISTAAVKKVSRSGVSWIAPSGAPSTSPLVFKTADGKYVKVSFSSYNYEDGTLDIKYIYSPSGDQNLSGQ